MRVVQITDTHLYADPLARSRRGVPARQFAAVVAAASAVRPDLVLVTGDISQDETDASYALAADTLATLDCPWFWIPGNHDAPETMAVQREVLPELDAGTWRLLQLDTRVVGEAHGEVGEAQRFELAERLDRDERPTAIVMHHPPMAVGTAWIDELGLVDGDAFWAIVERFAQVKLVLCGHVHQAFHGRYAGENGEIQVFATPSTSDQFLPGSDTFALDEASRPGFRVLDLSRGGFQSWVERVEV
ncbi:metallophosphoesterase [Halomonas sp. V046]|uniref:metallophosphoesterase n=1 Tax=Halomonas sp. V046 TaxID=3459611 RepID=UPI004044CCDB